MNRLIYILDELYTGLLDNYTNKELYHVHSLINAYEEVLGIRIVRRPTKPRCKREVKLSDIDRRYYIYCLMRLAISKPPPPSDIIHLIHNCLDFID